MSEPATTTAQTLAEIDQTIEALLEFTEDETREEWQTRVEEAKAGILERLEIARQGTQHYSVIHPKGESPDLGHISFLTGKLLNIQEEYDEKAEEALKEAVLLPPSTVDNLEQFITQKYCCLGDPG